MIHYNTLKFLLLMIRPFLTLYTMHFKCRGGYYPHSTVERFIIPDSKVSWSEDFIAYNPPNYTASSILGHVWADPDIGDAKFQPKWNELDGKVNRKSHIANYQVKDGFPLNPIGRTGIKGRGLLGRWGPNHAADPVVTRWKRKENGQIETDDSNRFILQFVAIKRRDTGEWALPGGMVDPGEKVCATAVREFREEATNSLEMTKEEKEKWNVKFEKFFSGGDEIYKGYVDDPRNTDNSWMETVAYNFHDETGNIVGALALQAGDDAVGVKWVDLNTNITLYANHKHIVEEVLRKKSSQLSKR